MPSESKCRIISKPNKLWEKYKDKNPFGFDGYLVHRHPMFNGIQFEFQINSFLVSVIQHDYSMKSERFNRVWEIAVIMASDEDQMEDGCAMEEAGLEHESPWVPMSRFMEGYCNDDVCGYLTTGDIKKCLKAISAYKNEGE